MIIEIDKNMFQRVDQTIQLWKNYNNSEYDKKIYEEMNESFSFVLHDLNFLFADCKVTSDDGYFIHEGRKFIFRHIEDNNLSISEAIKRFVQLNDMKDDVVNFAIYLSIVAYMMDKKIHHTNLDYDINYQYGGEKPFSEFSKRLRYLILR